MEYRQYHNLTEAYLSQVNEDTKQEELNEYFNLVKLLRNPKVMKYINRINTADTAAQLSTAADEFEQMDISDPQGDLDGDGIPNIADADADGDQLIDPLKGIDGVSDALLDRLIAAEVPRTRSYLDALNREKQKRIRNR